MGALRTAVAVVTALALGTPAAQAAPRPPSDRTLTLTGSGTGYVDVSISGSARFHDSDFAATGGTTYVGWVAQRVSTGDIVFGALRHKAWGPTPMRITNPATPPSASVPGGTFRLYLVADGPATVKVRVGGLATARTLAASNPASSAAGSVALGDAPIVVNHSPVTSTGRSLIVSAVHHSSTAGAAVRINACVRKTNTEECDPTTFGLVALNVLSSASTARVSWPGETAAGPWFAVHQVQAVAAGSRSVGVWFTLDATI